MLSGKRLAIASIIFASYIIILGIYYPLISSTYLDVTTPPQPREFQVPIYFVPSSGDSRAAQLPENSLEVGLNVTYPSGTLVVNDPIILNVTMVLRGEAIAQVSQMNFFIQNWLSYPVEYDEAFMPKQGGFSWSNRFSDKALYPDISNLKTVVNQGGGQVFWSTEGDYHPLIEVTFVDGTRDIITSNDVVFHVYPVEYLTQIKTNQVSVTLSIVVLILSFFSVLALMVQILDHTDTECNYHKNQTNNSNADAQPKKPLTRRFSSKKKQKH